MQTLLIKRFYNVIDVMELLGVKEAKAYRVMQELNKELKAKGYITISGKVPVKYFDQKYYC